MPRRATKQCNYCVNWADGIACGLKYMTNWKHLVAVLVFVLLTGCAGSDAKPGSARWIDPSQAVQLAAASPRAGVTGVFAMTVKATGTTDRVYLNSELDYRDQRNLTIAIEPEAADALALTLGAPPQIALNGKQILVAGTARRVKIGFLADGVFTDKYYYQTHVVVTKPAQIQLL